MIFQIFIIFLTNCLLVDGNNSTNDQKPTLNRRILTNGLLFSHSTTNLIPVRGQESLNSNQNNYSLMKENNEDKIPSDCLSSSSSSEFLSASDEKLLSRSDFICQYEQNTTNEHKASSLQNINMKSSKILYPIDFTTRNTTDLSWHQNQSIYTHQVPTSDSGIVTGTQTTSKSSNENVRINI